MKHAALVLGLVALFLFFSYPAVSPAPFAYDEADYMYAASRGFLANALDIPSLSFADYVRAGLSRGRDSTQTSALSMDVRRTGDLFLYRHAHGPVYFYWLDALSHWSTNEHFIRACGLIFPILSAIVMYLGCLWMLRGPQGPIAGVLAGALYLFSPAVIRSTEIAPHQMFTVWFVITLVLLAKLRSSGSRALWYAAVAMTGVAFCTLEVTFVLIAVVMVCGFLERKALGLTWSMAAKSVGLFAATVVILHPATITRLTFAKSYLFYAYLAVRRSHAWGNVTFAGTWMARFESSPVVWIFIAVAFLLWFGYRNVPGRREALPFLLFGMLMLATMLRVLTVGLRYVLPFLPALLVFTAIVLSGALMRLRAGLRVSLTTVASVALLIDTRLFANMYPAHPDMRLVELVAQVRQQNLGASRLLVPHDDLPTIHYYFPSADVTPYLDESALPAGRYDAIVRLRDSAKVDRIQ